MVTVIGLQSGMAQPCQGLADDLATVAGGRALAIMHGARIHLSSRPMLKNWTKFKQ
jgi:hypothetical protein